MSVKAYGGKNVSKLEITGASRKIALILKL